MHFTATVLLVVLQSNWFYLFIDRILWSRFIVLWWARISDHFFTDNQNFFALKFPIIYVHLRCFSLPFYVAFSILFTDVGSGRVGEAMIMALLSTTWVFFHQETYVILYCAYMPTSVRKKTGISCILAGYWTLAGHHFQHMFEKTEQLASMMRVLRGKS